MTATDSSTPKGEERARTGVLCMNVGSPDAPEARAVRRYLRQFLGDPRVVDINPIGRFLLLELLILPTRPKKSAAAYKKVWLPGGSPLLVNSRAFVSGLGAALGAGYSVRLGMRYGEPSIAGAMAAFRAEGVDRIVLFPMYPQYASSSTGTSLEAAYKEASLEWNVPSFASVPPFYDAPGLITSFADRGRDLIRRVQPDQVLFSFHGLPERQIRKSDQTGSHCLLSGGCCDAIGDQNRWCYRAQSFDTARRIATELALPAGSWQVTFQSRLGRTPWIRPYTDVVVEELAARGSKRIVVFCPAFVADCLETLEEIGMRLSEAFKAGGGEVLELVPSLNDSPTWIAAAAGLVRQAAGFPQGAP